MAVLSVQGGCASDRIDERAGAALAAGNYGVARAALQSHLTEDRADRNYILDRLRLLIATLADGQPRAADEITRQTFELLRTQGLNADRTTASVVLNEGVKIWKGEPFEQAMAYHYIAVQKAMLGEWDNARAAAGASLFLLKDFGENERGERASTLDIARRAANRGDDVFDKGYVATKTDFALGYLMSGVASLALERRDEAADNFREAARVNAGLQKLSDELLAGHYNTLFVIDYGRGPRKVGYGPDDALTRFVPLTRSDERGARVSIAPPPGTPAGSGGEGVVGVACDVNTMSANHMWNNLEDVRAAKSAIGTLLMEGGLITASTASSHNKDARQNQQIIGLSLLAIGALLKSTAHADLRHAELLPQRVYLAPATILAPSSTTTIDIPGEAGGRMTLVGLDPPRSDQRLQLRYVRMSDGLAGSAEWAVAGRVVYANDHWHQPVEGDDLPYILGGRCVCRPTPEVMERYRLAGHLTGMTVTDLENLYREEGIALMPEDERGRSHAHVLEGGDSLVPPLAGTAGYARLFGQVHAPYKPKSKAVQELTEKLARERAAGKAGSG